MSSARPSVADERISAGVARQLGVRWPIGVDDLLDALVQRANDAGANCNRKEMVAALVVASHALPGDALREVLVTYRQVRSRDIVPRPTDKNPTQTRRRNRG
jgi:hypothetical protein